MDAALVNTIAAGIIDTVERAGGAVTLVYIQRQVPGFVAPDPMGPGWCYEVEDGDDLLVFWDGMSEEGCEALMQALREGRVAMQQGNPIRYLYLVEGCYLPAANWVPIALAPASMATVQAGERLFLVPEIVADQIMQRAQAEGGGVVWRRVPP